MLVDVDFAALQSWSKKMSSSGANSKFGCGNFSGACPNVASFLAQALSISKFRSDASDAETCSKNIVRNVSTNIIDAKRPD